MSPNVMRSSLSCAINSALDERVSISNHEYPRSSLVAFATLSILTWPCFRCYTRASINKEVIFPSRISPPPKKKKTLKENKFEISISLLRHLTLHYRPSLPFIQKHLELIQRPSQRHGTKPQISALSLQKLQRPQAQPLFTQHVLVIVQVAPPNGAFPPPVKLPQTAIVALDEAYIVEVDVVLSVGGSSVSLGGSCLVRVSQCWRLFEQFGSFGRVEGSAFLNKVVERRSLGYSLSTRLANAPSRLKRSRLHILINSLAGPLVTACNSPIKPHAFLIVCLHHNTGSLSPVPLYSATKLSSAILWLSYTADMGNTSRSASAGRGIKARRSGSVREYTSCICSAGDTPSLWMSVVRSCGLASRGMKAGAVAAGSGFVFVDMVANGVCVPAVFVCDAVGSITKYASR